MKQWLFLLTTFLSGSVHAQLSSEPYTPTSANWICTTQISGENKCTLSIVGVAPANFAAAAQSGQTVSITGQYRIRKSRTPGTGPVLSFANYEASCTFTDPNFNCTATDLVTLSQGINVASNTSVSSDLFIYSTNPSALFDLNGDGQITVNVEGVAVIRFLVGLRGDALTQGLTLQSNLTVADAEQVIAKGIQSGWFSYIANRTEVSATLDGVVTTRCLNGLRDSLLISGLTIDSAFATSVCNTLMTIE